MKHPNLVYKNYTYSQIALKLKFNLGGSNRNKNIMTKFRCINYPEILCWNWENYAMEIVMVKLSFYIPKNEIYVYLENMQIKSQVIKKNAKV